MARTRAGVRAWVLGSWAACVFSWQVGRPCGQLLLPALLCRLRMLLGWRGAGGHLLAEPLSGDCIFKRQMAAGARCAGWECQLPSANCARWGGPSRIALSLGEMACRSTGLGGGQLTCKGAARFLWCIVGVFSYVLRCQRSLHVGGACASCSAIAPHRPCQVNLIVCLFVVFVIFDFIFFRHFWGASCKHTIW